VDSLESRAHGGVARRDGGIHPGADVAASKSDSRGTQATAKINPPQAKVISLMSTIPTSLTLYFHPLSSFCQKVLVALYENDTPFTPRIIKLEDTALRAELEALWPICKFPVLRDDAKGRTIPESSIIIEHLAQHYPGPSTLIPTDPDLASEMRLRDRFFDQYVNQPTQTVVFNRLRPEGLEDAYGVKQAKAQLKTAYGVIEKEMATKIWAIGDTFSMADCAAAPALFYANLVAPIADGHPNAAAYLDRLMNRASFARAVREAKPYFELFPQ
jgi:glutathione S-transferase